MATYDTYRATERYSASAIFTSAMLRLYGLVAAGIIITGIGAIFGDAMGIGRLIYGNGWIGFLLAFGFTIGMLLAANYAAQRGHIGVGTALYFAFTFTMGLFIAPRLALAPTAHILTAVISAGAMFVAMSVVGYTTKRDLSGLGSMLTICLLALASVMFLNLFILGSGPLFILLNLLLLPVFLGLTAWETKDVKQMAQEAATNGDSHSAAKIAVVGSIGLYLNVLNLFLIVLNLLSFNLSSIGDAFGFFSGD